MKLSVHKREITFSVHGPSVSSAVKGKNSWEGGKEREEQGMDRLEASTECPSRCPIWSTNLWPFIISLQKKFFFIDSIFVSPSHSFLSIVKCIICVAHPHPILITRTPTHHTPISSSASHKFSLSHPRSTASHRLHLSYPENECPSFKTYKSIQKLFSASIDRWSLSLLAIGVGVWPSCDVRGANCIMYL